MTLFSDPQIIYLVTVNNVTTNAFRKKEDAKIKIQNMKRIVAETGNEKDFDIQIQTMELF